MNGTGDIPWAPELWARLDQAVDAEVDRTGVAGRIMPLRGTSPDATTAPAEVIDRDTMSVADDAVVPLAELSVTFSLTEQQVDGEANLGTALTLATRAANLIAQAEDVIVFRGTSGADTPVFKTVRHRNAPATGASGSHHEAVASLSP